MDLLSRLRTPTGRRLAATGLSVVAAVMVVGAGWLGAYPFYTNVRAGQEQSALAVAFKTPQIKADYGHFVDGDPVTRIVIPKFSLDMIVVEGTGSRSLNTGAGHYPDTPLPGQPGNIGIAGHRTMYGKPFNRINEFTAGDKVYLITPFDKYTYEILPPFEGHANPWVVDANSWDVVSPTAEPMLTMTACHPIGSARQRIVARAKLVTTEPLVNAAAP